MDSKQEPKQGKLDKPESKSDSKQEPKPESEAEYNLDVDALLGGLESALARGQPLQKSMISFYNAGYKKEDIENAARKFQEIHKRKFAELGVEPGPQKRTIKTPVSDYSSKKTLEAQKPLEPKTKVFKSEIISDEDESEESKKEKSGKTQQVVSKYGEESLRAAEDIKDAIIEAISSIKKTQVYAENPRQNKPVVIQQRVSEYEPEPPTPLSKAITFLLIFLLLLLLGLLGAVFFFKEELIELFNNLSIN